MPATRVVVLTKSKGAPIHIALGASRCPAASGGAAYVDSVSTGSVAFGLLHPGDVILFIDGIEVEDAQSAATALKEAGGDVRLTVRGAMRQAVDNAGAECGAAASSPQVQWATVAGLACGLLCVLPLLLMGASTAKRGSLELAQSTKQAHEIQQKIGGQLASLNAELYQTKGELFRSKMEHIKDHETAHNGKSEAAQKLINDMLLEQTGKDNQAKILSGKYDGLQRTAEKTASALAATQGQVEHLKSESESERRVHAEVAANLTTSIEAERMQKERLRVEKDRQAASARKAAEKRNRTISAHLEHDQRVKGTLQQLAELEKALKSAVSTAMTELEKGQEEFPAPSPPPAGNVIEYSFYRETRE